MAAPDAPRRAQPCPVCGGQCARFPDLPHDDRNPFLTGRNRPAQEQTEQEPPRPKGKRRPAEDRARRPAEDR